LSTDAGWKIFFFFGYGLPLNSTAHAHAQASNLTPEWRAVLFVDFLRPLPFVPRQLNRLMIWLTARTSFVKVATRNHENWEKGFYEA
jgi:hypothetical protein